MGKNNSSKTRVVPVFNALIEKDPTGRSWLPRLLRLGSRADRSLIPSEIGELEAPPTKSGTWWGDDERDLVAPATLLELLLDRVDPETVGRSGDRDAVRAKRELLANKDAATLAEARALLKGGSRRRGWHVLEGPSYPDACLQTPEVLLVVEGKRTERKCTTTTRWMKQRSQLLRHMDGAHEVAGGRVVLGLLVVEGSGRDVTKPSPHWLEESNAQIEEKMVSGSLPHRSAEERERIVCGVLGVTTWQAVSREFGLPWPPVEPVT